MFVLHTGDKNWWYLPKRIKIQTLNVRNLFIKLLLPKEVIGGDTVGF
jgi:hypothetical protein